MVFIRNTIINHKLFTIKTIKFLVCRVFGLIPAGFNGVVLLVLIGQLTSHEKNQNTTYGD